MSALDGGHCPVSRVQGRLEGTLNGYGHQHTNGIALEKQSSTSFLTDAQRHALDAALADRSPQTASVTRAASGRLSRVSGGAREPSRASAEFHHERRSRGRGKNALCRVKKGGGGGKYTWGALMSAGMDRTALPVLDRNDPNYESDAEIGLLRAPSMQSQPLKRYKEAVDALIDEYFNSGDIQEASTTLQEIDEPEYGHLFVKRAVTRALDKHNHEREMSSILLSALYGEAISGLQVQKGFKCLVGAAPDLTLDVPDAAVQIATFIARAVIDDVLPPAFVEELSAGESEEAVEIAQLCQELLHQPKAGEQVASVWGCGAGLVLDETRTAMSRILKGYLANIDATAAEKALRELAVPFFHHEFVRQAVMQALHGADSEALIIELLGQLSECGLVSSNQLAKGFQRVSDNIGNDAPATRERFEAIVKACAKTASLDSSFQESEMAAANGHSTSSPETKAYKAAAIGIIKEYMASADTAEVTEALEELGQPELQHIFVKQAIMLALDRKDREREMVSVLLAELHPRVLSEHEIGEGFTAIMLSCEDLELDIPDAAHFVALFLGRAIVDEVLAPAFLTSVLQRMRDDSLGIQIVRRIGNLLGAKHAAERLQRCWVHPSGQAFSIKHLRKSFKALLEEYEVCKKFDETACCLRSLDAPHYHHELTKRALLAAFEKPDQAPALLQLLQRLTDTGVVSQTQLEIGFERVGSDLDDINLDFPNASKLYNSYRAQAVREGWLSDLAQPVQAAA
ncbi:g6048 [Coccomyxa viridis]|uniref:G6048 protein n=1 Tax=Coccomyxa viridis TaxID=1274662 RepID=A0ABP1FX05_9CHLO